MYSGSTLTTKSGRVMGAHQKIDRIARRHLERLLPRSAFPSSQLILHFEGGNGPDAIKRKSPAQDEPWHYFQPFDETDTQLVELIEGHYQQLVASLRSDDHIRASFEAAWLAHAIVDGLTPAHHYPYEEKLVELREGAGIESRTTIKQKLVMPGETKRGQLKNNWKMWGPKGLFTTHSAFELGVATLIMPLKITRGLPQEEDIACFNELGLAGWFRQTAQEIVAMDLYERFYEHGWTTKLSRDIRKKLAPAIVKTVCLAWYGAAQEANQGSV